MKPQNELALIVAYFLSRNDSKGHILLGYRSFSEAKEKIGIILDVNKNTIKNMRDEFDFHHQNSRVGWKRELRGSRLRVIEAFKETDNDVLLEIVKGILSKNNLEIITSDIHLLFNENRVESSHLKDETSFVPRGLTGNAAEDYFIKYFEINNLPILGELKDMREMGCGYDFLIKNVDDEYYVEVKGLADKNGGVLFTNKEWKIACDKGDKYYLALVKNISDEPELLIIQNPAAKLNAQRNLYTTVQVNWTVSHKILNSLTELKN